MVTLDVNPFDASEAQCDAEFEGLIGTEVSPLCDFTGALATKTKSASFQCCKCTYQTQNQELFDRHVVRHSQDRPFECMICDYRTVDHSKFVSHLVSHQGSKVVRCPFCSYASSASIMKLHMLKHRAMDLFDCSECDFSSNNPKSVARHSEVYHSQLFKCEYCTERMTKYSLIKHWDEMHGIKEFSAETTNLEFGIQYSNPSSLKHDSCQQIFHPEIKQESVQDPEDIDVVRIRTLSAQSHEEYESRDSTDVGIEQTYDCSVCEFSSSLKVVLKFHILKMHTVKISCRHCSDTMTQYTLIHHCKSIHGIDGYSDDKSQPTDHETKTAVSYSKQHEIPAKVLISGDKFMCSICNLLASRAVNIQTHIERLHQRKYVCSDCPVVMSKHDLIEHARVEHGLTLHKTRNRYFVEAEHQDSGTIEPCNDVKAEDNPPSLSFNVSNCILQKFRQFVCSICSYSNAAVSKVERHVARVHVKKFQCNHCPVVMSRYDLIKHSSTAHGVKMTVKTRGLREVKDSDETIQTAAQYNDSFLKNDYRDAYPEHVSQYVTRETKTDKPFACDICDFSSHNEWGLTCHMKFMHGVKYHCNYCTAIMTKFDIIQHSLREHGVEIRPRGPSGLRQAGRDAECHGDTNKFSEGNCAGRSTSDIANYVSDLNGAVNPHNPFSCTVCGFTATSNYGVSKHVDSMHRKKFCCPHCPAVMTKYELINHGSNEHGITIKPKNRYVKELEEDTVGYMDCSECDTKVDLPSDLPNLEMRGSDSCSKEGFSYSFGKAFKHIDNGTYQDSHNVRKWENALDWASVMVKTEPTEEEVEEEEEDLVPNPKTRQTSSVSKNLPSCSYCGYSSKIRQDVVRHVERLHTAKFRCDRCPAIMVKYDLMKHVETEHGILLPRNYRFREMKIVAGQESNKSNALTEDDSFGEKHSHESSVCDVPGFRVNESGNFECLLCSYSCNYRKAIVIHVERMHRKKYTCSDCPAVLSKHDLIIHTKDVHGTEISAKGGLFHVSTQNTDEHSKRSSCSKMSSNSDIPSGSAESNATMNVEQAILPGGKIQFKCSDCDFNTLYPFNLKIHIETFHTKLFCCDQCPAVNNKCDLLRHYESDHGIVVHKRFKGFKEFRPEFVASSEPSTSDRRSPMIEPDLSSPDAEFDHSIRSRPRSTLKTSEIGEYEQFLRIEDDDTFVCTICNASINRRYNFNAHIRNIHKKPFRCLTCSAVMSKYELKHHCEDVHDFAITFRENPKLFEELDEVEQNDPVADGPAHASTSIVRRGDEFLCPVCSFSSLYKTSVQDHLKCMHSKKFGCNDCSVVMSKHDLIQHYESVHGKVVLNAGRGGAAAQYFRTVSQDDNECVDGEDVTEVEDSFRCNVCGDNFSVKHNALRHIRLLHYRKYSCNQCSAVMTKHEMLQHQIDHGVVVNKGVRGHYEKHFTAVDQTSEEMDEHLDDASEPSAHDQSSVATLQDDEDWESSVFEEGRELKCTICNFHTKYRTNMKMHFLKLHKNMFSCNRCSLVTTKYGMVCHYEETHRFVIPNSGNGNLAPYCKAVDNFPVAVDANESSSVIDDRISGESEPPDVIQVEGGFKCSGCEFVSALSRTARTHFDVFHKKKYSCNNCSVVLSKYQMLQHYESDHNVIIENKGKGHTLKYFVAVNEPDLVTSQSGSSDDYVNIIKEGDEFKCKICMYRSSKKPSIITHLGAHHSKLYSCNKCSAVMTKYEMVEHYERDHDVVIEHKGLGFGGMARYCKSVDQAQDAPAQPVAEPSVDGDDDNVFIFQDGSHFLCSICNASFSIKKDGDKHLTSLHKKQYSCNHCSIVTTKYNMMIHFEKDHGIEIRNGGRGKLTQHFTLVDADATQSSDQSNFQQTSTDSAALNVETSIDFTSDEFRCTSCDHASTSRHGLKLHSDLLHTKLFSCNYCSTVLPKYDMMLHCKEVHGIALGIKTSNQWTRLHFVEAKDGNSASEEKKTSAKEEGGDSSLNLKPDDELSCGICQFSPIHEKNMGIHMTNFHQRKYTCKHCQTVMTKYDLIEHSKKVHGVTIGRFNRTLQEVASPAKTSASSSKKTQDPSCSSEVSFKCPSCDFSSKLRMHLRVHTKNMHSTKFSCGVCSEVMTKHELLDHHRKEHSGHESKSTKLNEADSSGALDDVSEADAMSARRSFDCEICSFTTKAKWYLKDHMVKFHQIKFHCTHCAAVLTKHHLIKHCKDVHGVAYSSRVPLVEASSGDRPGSSSTKAAGASLSKADHVQKGDMSRVQCPKCDYTTAHEKYLPEHMVYLHKKPHTCGHCSAVMTKHELFTHYKEEHGVVLNKFGRMPSVAGTISSGTKSEYGSSEFKKPKTFRCEICSFSSLHQFGLKRHVKIHHTVKYPCQHCPAVMTRHDLIKHCRRFHGTKTPGNHSEETNFEEFEEFEAGNYSDHCGASATDESLEIQVVNPKFQPSNTLQSPAFQPVVAMKRLPVDVDGTDSAFSELPKSS